MDNSTKTTTCLSSYTDQQCRVLSLTRIIISVLSIIGSLFLISVICLFRKYRRLNYRILLSIGICSFFNSFTILLAGGKREQQGNAWCTIRGMSLQFNVWGILLWQLALTINMFLNTVFMRMNRSYQLIERFYHVACWGIAIIATIIPLIFDKYGPAITWCWISDHEWRIWAFYVEFIVSVFVIFALYAKVVYTVLTLRPKWRERHTESVQYEVYKRRIRPMMFYPLAILIVSIVPIIYRINTFLHPYQSPSFTLAVLHVLSVPLWGMLFAVVYGLDPETRADLSLTRIMTTLQERLYGDSVQEVNIGDQSAGTSTTKSALNVPATSPNRDSNLSAISIEASTVYPSRSIQRE